MRTTSISFSSVVFLSLLFVGCTSIDTTGISASSSKQPTGNPSASVVVTEFGDLQCPACKAAHELITVPLLQKYSNVIRFEFKQFPLRSIHPYAFEAAQASECAADQNKFWEYLGFAYDHQEDLSKKPLEAWAKELGLNEDLFHRCLASGIKADAVLADAEMGTKLKVNSTPSYFVNGARVLSNDLGEISKAIEDARLKIESVPL